MDVSLLYSYEISIEEERQEQTQESLYFIQAIVEAAIQSWLLNT